MINNVTLVMPVFNDIKIIDEIICRVRKNIKSCESVLIIDDYSEDGTYEALHKEFETSDNVLILQNPVNFGPAYSRNIGLRLAKTKYVAFLDSDDDWHPQKIDIQLKVIRDYSAAVCGTDYEIINSESIGLTKSEYSNLKVKKVKFIKWPFILFKSPFPTPSVLIDKSMVNLYFDDSMRYSEDYEFWVRLSKNYKVIKICEPLTFTFKHDYLPSGSLSGNLMAMQQGQEMVFRKCILDSSCTLLNKFIIMLALLYSRAKYLRRLLIVWSFEFGKRI